MRKGRRGALTGSTSQEQNRAGGTGTRGPRYHWEMKRWSRRGRTGVWGCEMGQEELSGKMFPGKPGEIHSLKIHSCRERRGRGWRHPRGSSNHVSFRKLFWAREALGCCFFFLKPRLFLVLNCNNASDFGFLERYISVCHLCTGPCVSHSGPLLTPTPPVFLEFVTLI